MDLKFTGRFGMPQKECKVCHKELTEFRVLRVTFSHKDSKIPLGSIEYCPPLCDQHRGGAPLDMEVAWLDALMPLQDVMAP
jgi:hypothetical protein